MSENVNMLGCRLVEPSPIELEVMAVVGMPAQPYSDSIEDICERCQRKVWIGPSQQHIMATMSEMNFQVCCLTCAALAAREHAEELTVHNLGNPEGNPR